MILKHPSAKATFEKTNGTWKTFWMRAGLTWYGYLHQPVVKNLTEFSKLVEEDMYNCFFEYLKTAINNDHLYPI
ncbi:MAG: DUF3024 domain-containing protein [Bacteroidetes bacterium]|nr:DUF3024 domain-containing protein [Bacteroidota bacterium]MBS1980440.1 DUF3024 domain-containing protein [Bacteroidota bacterium]